MKTGMTFDHWQNYRIKIYPTEEQKQTLFFAMDCFRFVYNWCLNYHRQHYEETGKSLTRFSLAKAMEEFRHSSDWLSKCELTTCRYAAWNVIDAFERFFDTKDPKQYPKFKKKTKARRTFQLRGERMVFFEDGTVSLPGYCTSKNNRMLCKKHRIPIGRNYRNVYVTYDGNSFWLSLSIPMTRPIIYDDNDKIMTGEPLGIDVGIRTAAFTSDGTAYPSVNRHRLSVLTNRLDKLQSAIDKDRAKRRKESMRTKTKYADIPVFKNEIKRESKYRQTHRDLVNLFQSRYHKISREIVNKSPNFVVVESIDLRGLQRTIKQRISRDMHYHRLGVLFNYIEYKCNEVGIPVIHAPKDFPSTQLCSRCGTRTKVGGLKIYTCPNCGLQIDRDYNAALNLRHYGESIMTDACST